MDTETKQDKNYTPCLQLSDDQRFQVLMAQMNERYQAWHHMRSRSMQFTLWILGLAVAASWKLLQEPCVDIFQRIASTCLVLLLGGAATYFLKSLEKGVRTNREALINVETALSTHDQSVFLKNKAILPVEYRNTRPRASSHFATLYALLSVTSIYLLAAIWFQSCPSPENNPAKTKRSCLCKKDTTPSISSTNAVNQHKPKGETK
ncbi:MAG: hypothetical protein PF904_01765 [Kiritimatiellae bacterium]|jgi:hypothetical protein|nr:hypothetical protein [Kiritimatiellia bacterium]